MELPVGELSGGEQARVLIARLMLRPADLLILDEPTNDLDIPTLEVLEESLEEFPGALVLVTHDRFMLERLSSEILALDGEGGAHLYADLVQWENAQREANERRNRDTKSARKNAKKSAPARSKLTTAERREWHEIESRIVDAEAEVEQLRTRTEAPSIMADRHKLTAACEELTRAQDRVRRLYARWEELEIKANG
jgi:ATP-binding cassette subfamily F protein uup